jgi:L-fuculose-phosphate aldolase
MSDTQLDTCLEIVAVAQSLDVAGLMPGKSGNVSCRVPGGFRITPSGLPYADLDPGDLVLMDAEGRVLEGNRRPSSEWPMHTAVYAHRPDVGAIVHTHSPHATALACAGLGIPAFHYMIAMAGGDIRCTPYATFGSEALASSAVEGLEGRRAVLLGNHGVLAVASSLRDARAIALEVENLALQYLALKAAGLEPRVLDAEEIARVIEKFAGYGRLGQP